MAVCNEKYLQIEGIMNMFNISFLWMEISIVGSFFSFAHHLVELGSILASETIKEFQPAADAERKEERERACLVV